MPDRTHHVYILASAGRVLYVGSTSNLTRRLAEHRAGKFRGFTKRYNVTRLVYFETTTSAPAAVARERQLKGWRRSRKLALVESTNPKWRDLGAGWLL